jgi:hypothetical protein
MMLVLAAGSAVPNMPWSWEPSLQLSDARLDHIVGADVPAGWFEQCSERETVSLLPVHH